MTADFRARRLTMQDLLENIHHRTDMIHTESGNEDLRIEFIPEVGEAYMECFDADGDEIPGLVWPDQSDSDSNSTIEIEMENMEEPDNLAEFQRLD